MGGWLVGGLGGGWLVGWLVVWEVGGWSVVTGVFSFSFFQEKDKFVSLRISEQQFSQDL